MRGLLKYDVAILAAIAAAMLIHNLERRIVQAAPAKPAAEKKQVRASLQDCPWISTCSPGQICKAVYVCSDLTKRGKQ